MTKKTQKVEHNESGVVLIVSLILLTALSVISLTVAEVVPMKEKMVSNDQFKLYSQQCAEDMITTALATFDQGDVNDLKQAIRNEQISINDPRGTLVLKFLGSDVTDLGESLDVDETAPIVGNKVFELFAECSHQKNKSIKTGISYGFVHH